MQYDPLLTQLIREFMQRKNLPAEMFQDFYITLTAHQRMRKAEQLLAESRAIAERITNNFRMVASPKREMKVLQKLFHRNARLMQLNREITAIALATLSAIEREFRIERNKSRKV